MWEFKSQFENACFGRSNVWFNDYVVKAKQEKTGDYSVKSSNKKELLGSDWG